MQERSPAVTEYYIYYYYVQFLFNRPIFRGITQVWPGLPMKNLWALLTWDYLLSVCPYISHNCQCQSTKREDQWYYNRLQQQVKVQNIRSWSSDTLAVPTLRLSTVGDRAFPVIAARVWNALPVDVISSTTLPAYSSDCSRLNSSHGAFLMHDTAPAARDYLNCLSDFRCDIVMWSCSYLAYAT